MRDMVGFALTAIAVLMVMRFVPLQGARRIGVACLRVVALSCVLLALRGFSLFHRQAQPRHIVYLADQSSSIAPQQTAWIARRLASLEAVRSPQLTRAVLAFGEHPALVFPTERAALTDPTTIEQALNSSVVPRETTNLEAALLASLSQLPTHAHGRVILLSDGRQTAGSVERTLAHLRRFGLKVYPIAVPPVPPTAFVWERLMVPAVVRSGSPVPIQLVFNNATPHTQTVEVTVSLRALPLARRPQRVRPGWQVVSMSVPAIKAGTMALEVSVNPALSRKGGVNAARGAYAQRRTAFVEVEGPPRLLVVMERPTALPLFATALKHREMDIAVATPGELPTDAGALLGYDTIVFFQVPKSAFSEAQVEALSQYVERFGGGIVMVGLGGKLSEEIVHEAPLDRLLPVRFEPKGLQEATRRVCILLLIDRSASMMGPRIAATKRAAVELVKQLQPEDLVGVLAFDTVPYVVVEVQQVRGVNTVLIDKLVRLKSTGGTDIFPALEAAKQRLELSGATIKHVILLSDGQTPFESKAYRKLLEELKRGQITLSTIGIGAAFVNTELLEWLATTTGGTFYQMNNLDELPTLIARDTQNTLGQLPFVEGYFRPTRTPAAEWFAEIPEWPSLKGYLTTTAKPGAKIELEIRQRERRPPATVSEGQAGSTDRQRPESVDPLLAHWSRGLGRVAVFASDADTRWSPEWIRWPHFESVWAQVVRGAMRPQPTEELFVWLDDRDATAHLVIEGELTNPTAQLVSSDGRTTVPLALVQQSRFRWRARVSDLESGWYRLVLESRKDDTVVLMRRWVQIGHPSSGPEQRGLPPDEALLRRIAQATDGAYDIPDQAFLPPSEFVEQRVPLRGWLLPLVLLLLLVEVALRGRTML